jgi:DNA mismatch repair protein MutS
VHLDATEHHGQLVFLHAVKPGPANQSYGLQVASLAGVPKDVIRRARAYLHALENQQSRPQDGLLQGQLDFATPPPEETSELRNALDQVDPDSMTPREALEALYELKKL